MKLNKITFLFGELTEAQRRICDMFIKQTLYDVHYHYDNTERNIEIEFGLDAYGIYAFVKVNNNELISGADFGTANYLKVGANADGIIDN